jgi:AcrR family transcriptional regulator
MSTYHHGDLRAAVLAAAGKVIEKEGLGSLSVREAARRAGVSHNAPYRHFPDRDALLAALAAEGFIQLGKALDKRSGRELGEAYVRFALAHPQRFRLMFGGLVALDRYPELRTEARATHERLTAAFAGLGAEAQFAAAAAWSLVHGLAQLILDGHFEQKEEDFVKKVLGAIRFAVGREAPAQRSA